MTEETEAPPDDMPEREIDFQGRKMWIRFPSPEQLLVWKRIVVRLQSAEDSSWTGETAMAALERGRRVIDSILVHQADKDWLDDEMLDGRITLRQTARIITESLEAFAPEDNREARRASGKPAKKAARKKTPRKVT